MGLVVAGWVEGELAQELAGGGVDDADVEVVGDHEDFGVGVSAARGVVAPAGSELVYTGDSGVLVLPPVGGTFRPTASGFEIVTEHKVLAATGAVRVEQSCDEQLSCTVVAINGERREGLAGGRAGQPGRQPLAGVVVPARIDYQPAVRLAAPNTTPKRTHQMATVE